MNKQITTGDIADESITTEKLAYGKPNSILLFDCDGEPTFIPYRQYELEKKVEELEDRLHTMEALQNKIFDEVFRNKEVKQ